MSNRANATLHHIKTTSLNALSATTDALLKAFKAKGDVGKVYEMQLQMMKEGKAIPDQLLVKLKENKESKKPSASVLFSKLLDVAESVAKMTGSERAAAHIANFKDFAEMAVMGAEEMIGVLKKNGIEGMKTLYYGVQSGVSVMSVEKGYSMTDAWMKLLEIQGKPQ